MAEKRYGKLSGRYRTSYLTHVRRSLKELRSGNIHRMTAQRAICSPLLET